MEYILFSAEETVSISALHRWDGIIEYSYNNTNWKKWNGSTIVGKTIYMRGVNNTFISNFQWLIEGKNVRCQGNIENLLDYKSVINNVHPKMKPYGFTNMFYGCNSLIEAPQLSFVDFTEDLCDKAIQGTSLMEGCDWINYYWRMFGDCNSLIITPIFPNLLIAKTAIVAHELFHNCSIKTININNKLYDINVFKLL